MDHEDTIFWAALGFLYLLVACLSLLGCAGLRDLARPEIEFTQPIAEIPLEFRE